MKPNQMYGRFMSRNQTIITMYVVGMFLFMISPVYLPKDYLSFPLGGITLFTTLFLGYLNYQHAQDRLFKDLFKEFNERYDKLNDLYLLIKKYTDEVEITDMEQKDVSKIIDYLNLCAEQYFWFEKGRIDPDAWNSWKSGMQTWADLHAVKLVFRTEVGTWTSSYYKGFQGFFSSLSKS